MLSARQCCQAWYYSKSLWDICWRWAANYISRGRKRQVLDMEPSTRSNNFNEAFCMLETRVNVLALTSWCFFSKCFFWLLEMHYFWWRRKNSTSLSLSVLFSFSMGPNNWWSSPTFIDGFQCVRHGKAHPSPHQKPSIRFVRHQGAALFDTTYIEFLWLDHWTTMNCFSDRVHLHENSAVLLYCTFERSVIPLSQLLGFWLMVSGRKYEVVYFEKVCRMKLLPPAARKDTILWDIQKLSFTKQAVIGFQDCLTYQIEEASNCRLICWNEILYSTSSHNLFIIEMHGSEGPSAWYTISTKCCRKTWKGGGVARSIL